MTIKILPQEKEALQKVCAELGYKCVILNDDNLTVEANVNIFDPEVAYRIGQIVQQEMTRILHKEIYGE